MDWGRLEVAAPAILAGYHQAYRKSPRAMMLHCISELPHDLAYDARRLHCPALTDRLPPSRIALTQTTNWPPSPAVETFIELSREVLGGAGSESLLTDIGRQTQLSDEEFAVLEKVRDKTPARPVSFE